MKTEIKVDAKRIEAVEKAMDKCSWEEAREIGVRILAKWVGFHTYMGDEPDLVALVKDICVGGDKWVKEGGGALVVSMAKQARKEQS